MPTLRFHEMPLCRLPRATARRLITQLYAPDQRFARCFVRYWRDVMGQPADDAARSTAAELEASAATLLANLDDPHVHTIGVTHDLGYEPVGMYAVRPLASHPVGRELDAVLGPGRERRGLCHAVAIRDDHAGLRALRTVFVNIARRAVEADLDVLYFYSSDHRLADVYRHFGMEFPDSLALPRSHHLVGRYQVHRADNRARVANTAAQLGLIELPAAA
ncbi:MAG TPA: hypothetical protein VM734_16365 [Kofleriaceae bacterium]|jgi:hypothetical protein|nr:hypothetical protein [Kofleriaceae bacterium]